MIGNLWYTETATSNGYDEKYQQKKSNQSEAK
jgi:hypothetical protein